jgi:hypothetical protein
MANKPASRKWNDIQLAIATSSMALTLIFWNLFAGPDRASAMKRAQEQAAVPPQPSSAPTVAAQPTPLSNGKILFGGSVPQTQIIVQTGGRNGGGNGSGSGGGGGGSTTSTGSS